MARRLVLLTLSLLATPLFAQPRDGERAAVQQALESELVAPLNAKNAKRNRFSRALMPTQQTARVAKTPKVDAAGLAFYEFALLAPGYDEEVTRETGCIYVESQRAFIKRPKGHVSAKLLLGKSEPAPAATTCVATEVLTQR